MRLLSDLRHCRQDQPDAADAEECECSGPVQSWPTRQMHAQATWRLLLSSGLDFQLLLVLGRVSSFWTWRCC
jgi:hypothetical protein